MKQYIKRSQKYRAIARVLDNYPNAFSNKPEAEAVKNSFVTKSNEMVSQIGLLITPVSSLYQNRIDNRLKLAESLQNMINMGIMIANRRQDNTLLNTFMNFNTRIRNNSAPIIVEISRSVVGLLRENETVATDLGLTAAAVTEFETQLTVFEETLTTTQNNLDTRRLTNDEIKRLMKECGVILNLELDRFVKFNKNTFPAMHSNYMRLRRTKKSVGGSSVPADSDISGMVTNSVTGSPLQNAIINLIENGLTTESDADGYYLFDELEAGNYTVSCHATGFTVPEAAQLKLGTSDSLSFNFALTPVQG
jgi:hypothetical protein